MVKQKSCLRAAFFYVQILRTNYLRTGTSSVSLRYLSMEIPATKNTNPRMVSAQGLNISAILPKIPKTPITSAIAPPMVIIIAKTLIIRFQNIGYQN